MNQRLWVLGAMLLGLAGCTNPQTRLQADDDAERKKAKREARKKKPPKAKRTYPRGTHKKKVKKITKGQRRR